MLPKSYVKQSTAPKPKRKAVIFDVDGTLDDVSGVKYHVDLNDPKNKGHKDFASFHSASLDTPPHEWVAELARAFSAAGFVILVVTARKWKWRYHTLVWLHLNKIPYDLLQMRPDNDTRTDTFTKKDILHLLAKEYEIILAVEDNPHVLKLWEDEGLMTIQVPGWTSNSKPGTVFTNAGANSATSTALPQTG